MYIFLAGNTWQAGAYDHRTHVATGLDCAVQTQRNPVKVHWPAGRALSQDTNRKAAEIKLARAAWLVSSVLAQFA